VSVVVEGRSEQSQQWQAHEVDDCDQEQRSGQANDVTGQAVKRWRDRISPDCNRVKEPESAGVSAARGEFRYRAIKHGRRAVEDHAKALASGPNRRAAAE
jgi:hypothetical protein